MKISLQVAIIGTILSFYKGQKWVKIFTNRSGVAGGDPPLQSGQPTLSFFDAVPFSLLKNGQKQGKNKFVINLGKFVTNLTT